MGNREKHNTWGTAKTIQCKFIELYALKRPFHPHLLLPGISELNNDSTPDTFTLWKGISYDFSLPALFLPKVKKQENHTLRHSIRSCHHSTFSVLQISTPCDSMVFLLLHDERQTISHTHSYFTGQQSYNGELSLVKTLKPVGMEHHHISPSYLPVSLRYDMQGTFSSLLTWELADVKDNRTWRWVLSWVCWDPGMKCKN